MTPSERDLIAGCISGDKPTWDSFVQQYSKLVYHTVRRTLTLHHADQLNDVVEDLFQDCFIALLADDCRKLKQFRGDDGCTLASWLRVVASRLTVDFLRKQKKPALEVSESLASDAPGAPEIMAELEQDALLARAIQSLPARDRMIIELTYHQALPPQEIAAILKISVGALYTQKSRILDRLRSNFAFSES